MGTMRVREVKEIAQGHTVSKLEFGPRFKHYCNLEQFFLSPPLTHLLLSTSLFFSRSFAFLFAAPLGKILSSNTIGQETVLFLGKDLGHEM